MLTHCTWWVRIGLKPVEFASRVTLWLVFAATCGQFLLVTLRYGLDSGSIFLQEMVLAIQGIVFLLPLGEVWLRGGHVALSEAPFGKKRLRSLQGLAEKPGQEMIKFSSTSTTVALLMVLPFGCFLTWVSIPWVIASWDSLEGSRELDGFPFVFLSKSLLPVAGILLVLAALGAALDQTLGWFLKRADTASLPH